MKFIPVLLALILMAYVSSGTPARASSRRRDRVHLLVNRPTKEDMFNARFRRSDQPGVKGRPVSKPVPVSVRKGEYICGNKICKLQPGEVPKGCIGCQYPIL